MKSGPQNKPERSLSARDMGVTFGDLPPVDAPPVGGHGVGTAINLCF